VQKNEKNSFGLLELEMAELDCFFEKNGLGLLRVNSLESLFKPRLDCGWTFLQILCKFFNIYVSIKTLK
jgi:hypothetical protein